MLIDQFTASWERGEPVQAEDYLDRLPPGARAELIYHEYCLAEADHLDPDPLDYLRRFPDHSAALSRLFALHDVLSLATLERMVAPGELPDAGDEIGPYRLLRELGRGAFARVFLAEQADLGDRLVVVKVSTRPSSESTLLARARHANIVEVLRRIDADEGALHLVCLPFLGGATLGEVLAAHRRRVEAGQTRPLRSGRDFLSDLDRASAPEYPATELPRPAREVMARLSYPQALAWMVARLAEALDHAQRRGVTHGDVKPSNILITADGTPMLFDFNLAVDRYEADRLEARTDLGGTLAYMAPERLRVIADAADPTATPSRHPLDRHRADLYALGLVLLEALTGQPPLVPDRRSTNSRQFASSLADSRGGSIPRPGAGSRSIPPALRAILARCLAPDPSDRYARGGELAEDLDRWRSNRPLVHAPEPARSAWLRQVRSLRFPIVAFGLTATVALAVCLMASRAMQGTQRDQAMSKWDHILDWTEGVFKNRRFGQWQSNLAGDPIELANRHLGQYNVADMPRWRDRDDVRSLPDRERGELEAWMMEQVLRKAVALGDRPNSPQDWERALFLLDRAIVGCPATAFRNLRSTLRDRLGKTTSDLDLGPLDPALPPPPAWLECYLTGVAAEPLHAREALGHYLDALRIRPDLFWADYRASVVAWRIGEYPIAAEHLRVCAARRLGNRVLLTQHAGLLHKLEQDAFPGTSLATPGDAQAECDRALALDPDFAEALFTRTLIRQAAGQSEGVRADIDRFALLTHATNPAQALALRFTSRFGYGPNLQPHTQVDETLLQEAIHENPTNEDYRMLLGTGYDFADRGAEAIEQYDQVLRSNPNHLRARYQRAVQNRHADYNGTIAEFTALIDHPRFEETFPEQPSMIHAYHHVATDLLNRGKLVEAEAVAQRSLTAIRQSTALRSSTILARSKGADQLAPEAETFYLLARIDAVAAATDPRRWDAALIHLGDAFARYPQLRHTWFARDYLFDANRAQILEQLDRRVDQ